MENGYEMRHPSLLSSTQGAQSKTAYIIQTHKVLVRRHSDMYTSFWLMADFRSTQQLGRAQLSSGQPQHKQQCGTTKNGFVPLHERAGEPRTVSIPESLTSSMYCTALSTCIQTVTYSQTRRQKVREITLQHKNNTTLAIHNTRTTVSKMMKITVLHHISTRRAKFITNKQISDKIACCLHFSIRDLVTNSNNIIIILRNQAPAEAANTTTTTTNSSSSSSSRRYHTSCWIWSAMTILVTSSSSLTRACKVARDLARFSTVRLKSRLFHSCRGSKTRRSNQHWHPYGKFTHRVRKGGNETTANYYVSLVKLIGDSLRRGIAPYMVSRTNFISNQTITGKCSPTLRVL